MSEDAAITASLVTFAPMLGWVAKSHDHRMHHDALIEAAIAQLAALKEALNKHTPGTPLSHSRTQWW